RIERKHQASNVQRGRGSRRRVGREQDYELMSARDPGLGSIGIGRDVLYRASRLHTKRDATRQIGKYELISLPSVQIADWISVLVEKSLHDPMFGGGGEIEAYCKVR